MSAEPGRAVFADDVDEVLAEKVGRHATDNSPDAKHGEFSDDEYTEFSDARSTRISKRREDSMLRTIAIVAAAVTGGIVLLLVARWILRGLVGRR